LNIAELTAFHVRIPLRKPIRHALHSRTSTDNVLVRCILEDGTEGFGEGVPRDYVTGETIDSALHLLRTTDLAGQFEPCRDFGQAVTMAERLQLNSVPGDERGCQGNAARCALELALLDAYGRFFGEPLSTITRLTAGELYEPRTAVQYSGAITSANGFKVRLAAWRMRVFRFRHVKVKVGMDGHNDVARLAIIRSRLGAKRDIRVDANEAWRPGQVVERIRELQPFQISAVEQPVAHEQVAVLREVRQHGDRAIAGGICDLFNIRLSKCGGYIPSLRLAQLAKRHGLAYQLGCQVGETAILSAAGRHFAASVAENRYVEGSYDRYLVQAALGTQDITFRWGGWAKALPGPGLGIRLDPEALRRVVIRKEPLLG